MEWELPCDLLFIHSSPSPRSSPPHQGAKHLTALIENHQLEWQEERGGEEEEEVGRKTEQTKCACTCMCVNIWIQGQMGHKVQPRSSELDRWFEQYLLWLRIRTSTFKSKAKKKQVLRSLLLLSYFNFIPFKFLLHFAVTLKCIWPSWTIFCDFSEIETLENKKSMDKSPSPMNPLLSPPTFKHYTFYKYFSIDHQKQSTTFLKIFFILIFVTSDVLISEMMKVSNIYCYFSVSHRQSPKLPWQSEKELQLNDSLVLWFPSHRVPWFWLLH